MNYEGKMEVSKNRSATSRNVSQGNGHTYMTVVELNVCLWALPHVMFRREMATPI